MSNELIELPEGWGWIKISDVAEKVGSGATPRGGSEAYKPSGTPLIRSMNVHFDGLKLDGLAYLDDKQANELKNVEVKANDVLLNITGASIGRVTQAPPEMDGARVNQHVCIIRTKPILDTCFLSKYLASPAIQNWVMAEEYGATRQALTKQMILNFDVPLPPLNEQKRIVAKIEELRDRHQRAKQALEAIPKLCDRFRQSVLAAAFRGDLTADWREENPDVEPASVLLEKIHQERRQRWEAAELDRMRTKGIEPKDNKWKSKYKEPQSFEQIDQVELPDLADGWIWMSADECTFWITDGEHATPERSENGVYLLSARNVLDGRISLEKFDYVPEHIHKKLEERLKIEPGDVLLSCSGTVGRSCVVPHNLRFSLVRSVAVLKPLFCMGEYLSLALRSNWVQRQIESKKTQTAQSNIFQGRIKTLSIPVAPLAEQQQVIQAISQALQFINSIESTLQDAQKEQTFLNQSILAKAFRGELVEQDPNDEPASVLLERIRAEREKADNGKKTKGKRAKQLKLEV